MDEAKKNVISFRQKGEFRHLTWGQACEEAFLWKIDIDGCTQSLIKNWTAGMGG